MSVLITYNGAPYMTEGIIEPFWPKMMRSMPWPLSKDCTQAPKRHCREPRQAGDLQINGGKKHGKFEENNHDTLRFNKSRVCNLYGFVYFLLKFPTPRTFGMKNLNQLQSPAFTWNRRTKLSFCKDLKGSWIFSDDFIIKLIHFLTKVTEYPEKTSRHIKKPQSKIQ